MKYCFLLSFLLFSNSLWARVGQVTVLKGAAFINGKAASEGHALNTGDQIKTETNSYLKMTMVDATSIQVASSSSIKIASYSKGPELRNNNISLLYGKLRVLVKKVTSDSEQINFKANQISLGVRGTEFMVNAYENGGARTVDTLLLKGELKVSGASFENFTLNKSQYFNSQALERQGMSAIKKLEVNLIDKLLEGKEEFLPELKLENGHLDLSKFFSQKMLGIIPSDVFVNGVGSMAKNATSSSVKSVLSVLKESNAVEEGNEEAEFEEQESKPSIKVKNNSSKLTRVKGVTKFHYKLRKERWDIRDAVLNRKSNIENNLCFYYIYKKLPDGSGPERFRRERRCDDFEFDL